MDWLIEIGQTWLNTAKWVGGLGIAFAILVRLMPCNPGMYWWKTGRALLTDFIYWFVMPIFFGYSRIVLLFIGVVVLYGGHQPELLPVKGWPLWVQFLVILLLQDVILYWIHRVFHSRLAWKFHAVHHSPTVLDWVATMRTHPVNYVLEFTVADVIVLLLGFAPGRSSTWRFSARSIHRWCTQIFIGHLGRCVTCSRVRCFTAGTTRRRR